ncbi:lytic murein transglycosylase B [Pseudomonas sp. NW5]|uniref:lytic murein transglycosylase B n=1 Tax=Pseudomonas sp. NW5 TaxID=2934934 RepID=UPI002021ACAE|nr:lytic murein transglycosylase B [Pseudomonas sp. NW5]MCL7461151.1 lytic murein transglycosylase B [Pseudomonas sp. NW5]
MHRLQQWVRGAGLGLLGAVGIAPGVAMAYDNPAQLEPFIAEMTREHGFAEEGLRELFAGATRQQKILDAISRPAERVKPWKEYRPIFITEARISQGAAFWQQHAEALARAEREYGVPAEVIVAIIGVETFYGRHTGTWPVLDALATLGFDYPPRADFFRKELREFLLLTREQQVDPQALKGSYAGAMGLPQFMPSSFRAYAVDFDGDGRIDIWNNPVDAIGSVASYFQRHGWVAGDPVVSRARVQGRKVEQGLTQGLEPTRSVQDLRAFGWQAEDKVEGNLAVTAFRLEGEAGAEYWMGLPNFYVITRYNRSVMYAMAVHQLSEALRARHQER